MLNLTYAEMLARIAQFDQAMYNHEHWHRSLVRTLVARLPPDSADLLPDAHHWCRFGQWYDGEAAGPLGDYPAFIALGIAHERMHAGATQLPNGSQMTYR